MSGTGEIVDASAAARRVLVTGAAGYVGGLLVEALDRRPDIDLVLGIDMKPRPGSLAGCAKLSWIEHDLSLAGWEEKARAFGVETVVHCAFQIRELYGRRRALQERWNLEGARSVFAFAFAEASVRRLIHFSTVTAYGAFAANSVARRFTEADELGERDYLYGAHKRRIEAMLRELHAASGGGKDVLVLRPASITGPRGRGVHQRFGLVSTLAGILPFIPVGRRDWCRQYLHEDEAAEIVSMLVRSPPRSGQLDVLNLSPEDLVTAKDFADLFAADGPLRKKVLLVPPVLVRACFALLWHLSRGRVTTPPGGWKFLTYPVAVDGSKLTSLYGYHYRYSSREALGAKSGHGPVPEMPAPRPLS